MLKMELLPRPIDPAQLARIESVHRGFLYQHLYATACLLSAEKLGAIAVVVERDEDLEISFPDAYAYIQVKTRGSPLVESDLVKSIANFNVLRSAHASGTRAGNAMFFVVSNRSPGPALLAKLQAPDWPADVAIVHPGNELKLLPTPWHDINGGLSWCIEQAATVPFSLLSPELLVWKVAGHVLLASSASGGHADHVFEVAQLPGLFEQLVLQMQDFPVIPSVYRPQTDEPPLVSPERVRIITAFSGAGKTAWASNAALHCSGRAAYFDVGDIPGAALASALAREIVARLAGDRGVRGMLLPGTSGVDALRLLERYLVKEGQDAIVVVDNAHRASADDLLAILTATSRLRFVLLAQPSAELDAVRSRLSLEAESLRGWDNETVAAEISAHGARADYAICQRLIDLTGGLPLYVQNAVQVVVSDYDGNTAAFCDDVEAQTHLRSTAQETILTRFYESLSTFDQSVLAAWSVAACPITLEEGESLVRELIPAGGPDLGKAVRRLNASGAVRVFGNRRIKVHDAIRLVGKSRLDSLASGAAMRVHLAFKDVLVRSLAGNKDVSRLALLVHELGIVGDIDTLTDIASDEMFHEMGLTVDFMAVLERASLDPGLSAVLRFWALDTMAFTQLHRGETKDLAERIQAMDVLVREDSLGVREQLALQMKVMVFAALEGRGAEVERAAARLLSSLPTNSGHARMVRYNVALSFFKVGSHQPARMRAWELVAEYYDSLGIQFTDVVGRNPDDIWPLLSETPSTQENLKRLADTLDLYAQCSDAVGEGSNLARLHAVKFYSMAGAYRSTFRVGQDLVDEFLRRGDRVGARHALEKILLPTLEATKLVEWVIPVRSQYAVVLAHCGDFDSADREMAALAPYEGGLPEKGMREFRRQRAMVSALRHARPAFAGRPAARRVGRNEPCPCGSGLKFKKCHGAG